MLVVAKSDAAVKETMERYRALMREKGWRPNGNIHFRTYASAMLSKTRDAYHMLYVDEVSMLHAAELVALVNKTRCREAKVFGDTYQLLWRVDGQVAEQKDYFTNVCDESTWAYHSYRLPETGKGRMTKYLQGIYGKRASCNGKKGVVKVSPYDPKIDFSKYDLILVATRKEEVAVYRSKTIAKAQGASVDHVLVIDLNASFQNPLLNCPRTVNVALTRFKKELLVLTSRKDSLLYKTAMFLKGDGGIEDFDFDVFQVAAGSNAADVNFKKTPYEMPEETIYVQKTDNGESLESTMKKRTIGLHTFDVDYSTLEGSYAGEVEKMVLEGRNKDDRREAMYKEIATRAKAHQSQTVGFDVVDPELRQREQDILHSKEEKMHPIMEGYDVEPSTVGFIDGNGRDLHELIREADAHVKVEGNFSMFLGSDCDSMPTPTYGKRQVCLGSGVPVLTEAELTRWLSKRCCNTPEKRAPSAAMVQRIVQRWFAAFCEGRELIHLEVTEADIKETLKKMTKGEVVQVFAGFIKDGEERDHCEDPELIMQIKNMLKPKGNGESVSEITAPQLIEYDPKHYNFLLTIYGKALRRAINMSVLPNKRIGINMSLQLVVEHFLEYGILMPFIDDWDYSKYDRSIAVEYLLAKLWIYSFFGLPDFMIDDIIAMAYEKKVIMNGMMKIKLWAQVMSGKWDTLFGNSMINGMMMAFEGAIEAGDVVLMTGDDIHRMRNYKDGLKYTFDSVRNMNGVDVKDVSVEGVEYFLGHFMVRHEDGSVKCLPDLVRSFEKIRSPMGTSDMQAFNISLRERLGAYKSWNDVQNVIEMASKYYRTDKTLEIGSFFTRC